MYRIKSLIYTYFDKTQKSAICNYLRALVKQNLSMEPSAILDKFLEDEKYYLELKASRFPFLEEYLDSDLFIKETTDYINECIKYYKYKESQKPLLEAQKEFERNKRKFIQEVKMSKEPPTQKQLYYYKRLCKRYRIEPVDLEEASRLDLRNEIDRILNEYSNINTNAD